MMPPRCSRVSRVLLLLCVVASVCATTGNYQKILASWVGSDVNRLIQSWGPQ